MTDVRGFFSLPALERHPGVFKRGLRGPAIVPEGSEMGVSIWCGPWDDTVNMADAFVSMAQQGAVRKNSSP